MKIFLIVASGIALTLSAACAPVVPTIDPAQIQASAMAAASTMIAMTQAAIPTPTDIPPTDTPAPTPLPLPTIGDIPTFSVAPAATSTTTGEDNCNHLLDVSASGNARAHLQIVNNTKGSVTLTIGLGSKNAFGQCGYLAFTNIGKMSTEDEWVPQTGKGPCYWAYAFVNDPKHQTTVSGGGYCMNNPDKWIMTITYDSIHLTPP